jgi:DsbC/DsbD-like thiol-disulfide interchange protein
MITRRRAIGAAIAAASMGFVGVTGLPRTAAADEPASASPWSPGLGARMRLLRGAPLGDKDGFGAGIEIALEPGFRTYWRMPGAAGLPPLFDWSGSRNLASIAPAWPVPRRFDEAGVSIIGYEGDNVVLPLRVAATDPGLPVDLSISLTYAACKTICVPEQAQAALSLRHEQSSGLYAAKIEAAAREVPKRIEAAAIGLDQPDKALLILSESNRGLTLRPRLDGEERILDVFVEGPERWLFGAPRHAGNAALGEIGLPLLDQPKRVDKAAEIPFTLTILTDLRALETMILTHAQS